MMGTGRRTYRRRLVCLLVVLLGLVTPQSWAQDFSAERIVKKGRAVVSAHVNAKQDRWRLEFAQPQGVASVVIVRTDREVAWLIMSQRRQYLEVPIDPEYRLAFGERMEGEQSRELVGEQTLQGYPTELFDVAVAERGGIRRYYQWVTKVERFPVKTVSKEGDWSEEYRRLIFTEQSPLLFELPQRLDRANPPANIHH
ncbi:MAG TPA: hypothetical protein VF443_02130 [Nitrospira sp.]